MQVELKADVGRRITANAAEAGKTVEEYLEGLIERDLPGERSQPQASRPSKAANIFTPLQMSFSLWLRGFVNAALNINTFISVMCMAGFAVAYMLRNRLPAPALSGIVTLSFGLATFSQVGAFAVALLSALRYMYARFSLPVAAAGTVGLIFYVVSGYKIVDVVQRQDWKSVLGIVAAFFLTVMSGVVAAWGVRNSDPAKTGRAKKGRRLTWRDYLSWRWNPNLHEEVKEVYAASKAAELKLKAASEVTHSVLPTDIGGDFKAWNDTAKLLITILTGLTVISSLFGDGSGAWEQAFRIIMPLILLVPALSCAYMEGFRRQCERHWQALGMTRADESH